MKEDEVMLVTDLSKSSLKQKRVADVFRSKSATGKKIHYLRSDVEAYGNGCPRTSFLSEMHKKNIS